MSSQSPRCSHCGCFISRDGPFLASCVACYMFQVETREATAIMEDTEANLRVWQELQAIQVRQCHDWRLLKRLAEKFDVVLDLSTEAPSRAPRAWGEPFAVFHIPKAIPEPCERYLDL